MSIQQVRWLYNQSARVRQVDVNEDQMDGIFKTLYINPFYDQSMH